MLKYTFNQKDEFITIPVNLEFDVVDKEEAIRDYYIEEELQKAIPPQIDYEVIRYTPTNVNEIRFRLFKDENDPFTFADFGFSNDDVLYFYNKIKFSFLNVNFYDTNDKLQRKLYYQTNLFSQRVNLFLDPNYPDAALIPMVFSIKNPAQFNNETEGFYIYLKRSDFIDTFNLYCNFRFNSALDGTSYVFYPKKNLTVATVNEKDEYVKLNFNDKSFLFDTTGNTLLYTQNLLTIDLYVLDN